MAQNKQTDKVPTTSADITQDRLDALRQLLPEAFTEGQIDFDRLRAALGHHVDDRPERYTFTWAGKRNAIRLLQTPTTATLVPDRSESIDFDDTNHVFIEGENLEVLKLLYKAYFGKVKMIYIDPPYNTGNDFVYPDNYADPLEPYLQLTGQKDAAGNLLTSNTDSSGRFHSNWLSMMYPRLFVARQLLRDEGTIFVSIDDHEVHNLRLLMNEIFGEENFLATVVWEKVYAPKPAAKTFSTSHDYLVVYSKNVNNWERFLLPRTEEQDSRYTNPDNDPRGPWASDNLLRNEHRDNSVYTITSPITGKRWTPKRGTSWRHPEEEMRRLIDNNEIWFGQDGNGMPRRKKFLKDVQSGLVPETIWSYEEVGHTQDAKRQIIELFGYAAFDTPKPSTLIGRAAQITTKDDDIILDFFAGSAATAQAIIDLNRENTGDRRFVLVQLPEPVEDDDYQSIADIGKERIRRVIQQLQSGDNGKFEFTQDTHNLDLGFRVFKLAPSHFKPWSGSPDTDADTYHRQLDLFRDPLIDGWQPEPVIWEIALKEGYPLHSRLTQANAAGHTVYRVTNPDTDQHFHICLESEITADLPRHLNLTPDDLFVCRDLALDDTTAANLALQCRLKTI